MKKYNKQTVLYFVSKCNSMREYNNKKDDSLPSLYTIRTLGWMEDCLKIIKDNQLLNSENKHQQKTLEFIKKATKLHNGKYDYSKVEYIDCKKPVEIICPTHGSFLQTPECHLRVRKSGYVCGCPICGREHQYETEKYWTKEKIFEFASNYKTAQEFKKNHNGAYAAAQRMGLLKELRKNWKSVAKRDYWTEERCVEVAKTCVQISDVQKKYPQTYILLKYKYKILNDLFPISNRDPNAKIGIVYAYVWEELKTVYIGSTIRLEDRDKEHRHCEKDTVYKFSKEYNVDIPKLIILLKNLAMEEMLDYETIIFPQKYKENGYTVISKPIRSIGMRNAGKWNKQSCYDEAKKYNTLQDFIKYSSNVYYKAKIKGWLKDYIWLENVGGTYWTEEHCKEEAKKYSCRNEFRKNAKTAYKYALKNKWIDNYTWFKRPPVWNKGKTKNTQ